MKKLIDIIKSMYRLVELAVLLMFFANFWVFSVTKDLSFDKISKIHQRDSALVLGTSPKTMAGVANPYFVSRMNATALLYHHGKVKKIIVSGEKSPGYNEPFAMKNYLIYQEGVPESIIRMDTLGFSTRRSVENCKTIFHKKEIIIVSQEYHNLRALFFARNYGMDALAFDAKEITQPKSYYRNLFREFFARVYAVSIYLFGLDEEVNNIQKIIHS